LFLKKNYISENKFQNARILLRIINPLQSNLKNELWLLLADLTKQTIEIISNRILIKVSLTGSAINGGK
jgi:hypothetical protein